ncbi:hypothetical protein BGZ58_002332 [Dissophora ornata]|nr:hypothetical protein BGZ58_002332 [Dissophora ornata]
MEHPDATHAASPSPSLSLDTNVNANGTNNNILKPAQHVLGFLRKRSNLSAAMVGGDRAKSVVVSSATDFESALPSPTPTISSSNGNALKNLIRRKSTELARTIDGNSSTTSKGSNSDST